MISIVQLLHLISQSLYLERMQMDSESRYGFLLEQASYAQIFAYLLR